MRLAVAFFICCFALNHGAPKAAEIKASPILGIPDTAMIILSGDIESSDYERFKAAAAMYPKAIVAFGSRGGDLVAGINIGTFIRLRNYTTLVPSGVTCASACATAWLGGTRRLMSPDASIGFHAAYTHQNGQATETGVGNAIFGAYLNKLGLPDRAVVFITQAHPNEMTWLKIADAEQLGIDVSVYTTPGEDSKEAPSQTPPPAISQPSPPPSIPVPPPSTSVRWYEGMDAPDGDLGAWLYNISDASSCMRMCALDSGCVGITYNIKRSVCIRKKRIGNLIPARDAAITGVLTDRTRAPNSFSGPTPRVRRYENIDIPGYDRGSWIRGVSSADCESICIADRGCAGYTYNRKKTTCILKNYVGRLVNSNDPAVTGVLEGR